MKTIITLVITIALTSSLFAQKRNGQNMNNKMDRMENREAKKKFNEEEKVKDCVMMENGKMMVMERGTSRPMDTEMTLQNGTVVMPDGKVKLNNGKKRNLKDGDCIYMDGKMGKINKMKMMNHM